MKSYVQVIRAHPFVEEMRFTLLKMDATAHCNNTHEEIPIKKNGKYLGISEELACVIEAEVFRALRCGDA